MNIPNAIYAIDISKNPNIAVNVAGTSGVLNTHKIPKYTNVNSSAITVTSTPAKNFPSVISTILLGDVISSCSVPFFLSSANILIVRSGIKNTTPYITTYPKTY